MKAELSASEARRAALTAPGFNAMPRHEAVGAARLCKGEELCLMASWLGLRGLAIAPVAGIDRLFATLQVEAHPAFAELAPAQSEMACYG